MTEKKPATGKVADLDERRKTECFYDHYNRILHSNQSTPDEAIRRWQPFTVSIDGQRFEITLDDIFWAVSYATASGVIGVWGAFVRREIEPAYIVEILHQVGKLKKI